MLVATFGPSTGWAGKTITSESDVFVLEGHGPITAADVMEHDRQGHLAWASAGTRAWVGSLAARDEPIPATVLESDAAKRLDLARQQFAEGQPKKAIDTLRYVVPGAWTDAGLARSAFALASEIRATSAGRLDADCDELMASAQAALAAHSARSDLRAWGERSIWEDIPTWARSARGGSG